MVIYSDEEKQHEQLDFYLESVKPLLFLDNLGGALSGEILGKMREGSHMISLGNLTHEPLSICSNDLRWHNKSISGFMIDRFLNSLEESVK